MIMNTSEIRGQRHERIVYAIRKVENELDERRQKRELIGQVQDGKTMDTVRIKRRVTFTWQRGIKIGTIIIYNSEFRYKNYRVKLLTRDSLKKIHRSSGACQFLLYKRTQTTQRVMDENYCHDEFAMNGIFTSIYTA